MEPDPVSGDISTSDLNPLASSFTYNGEICPPNFLDLNLENPSLIKDVATNCGSCINKGNKGSNLSPLRESTCSQVLSIDVCSIYDISIPVIIDIATPDISDESNPDEGNTGLVLNLSSSHTTPKLLMKKHLRLQ